MRIVVLLPKNWCRSRIVACLLFVSGHVVASEDGVEVALEQPEAIIVSKLIGNTVRVGAEARFTVSITTEPKSEVVVSVESSDPLEGVTSVDALTFTSSNWKRQHEIVVTGTNPSVFNGEQNYSVVLGVAESDDPAYAGLDPADVKLEGLMLELENDQPIYFVSGVEHRHRVGFDGNGNSLSHTLYSAEAGLTTEDRYGDVFINWNPPRSAEGTVHSVDIISTMNEVDFENTLTIKILPSSQVSGVMTTKQEISPTKSDPADYSVKRDIEMYEVTDESSSLNGMLFGFPDEVPAEVGLREVSVEDIPRQSGVEYLTSGFYTEANTRVILYFPFTDLDDVNNIFHMAHYRWSSSLGRWGIGSSLDALVIIDGKEYVRLDGHNAHGVGVVALRPRN